MHLSAGETTRILLLILSQKHDLRPLQFRQYQCQHGISWRTAPVTAKAGRGSGRDVAEPPWKDTAPVTAPALSNPAPAVPGDPGAPLAAGELLRLTSEYLAAWGIPVKPDGDQLLIAPAAKPRSKKKARETRAARCTLTVDDDADARLYFLPWAAETADGHWLADIAAALLTGTAGTGPRHPGTSSLAAAGVKATSGLDLRDRGLTVELNTYEDDHCFHVVSDVSVTVPGLRGPEWPVRGVVYVSDDGTVYWERCYWYEDAVLERGAGPRSWLPDPSAVARSIAGTVTAAVRTAWPELATG